MKGHSGRQNVKRVLGALAILIATGLAYRSTWDAPPLAWDDDYNIWKNSAYLLGPWWQVWKTSNYGMYIPVTSTAWALLYHLGAGSAWPFRFFNFLIHLLNTALVAHLLSRCERHFSSEKKSFSWPVFFGTFLFAIHPLQVATVVWISGGRDLLAAFFALAATALFFADPDHLPRKKWLATLLFTAGLLSKPGIVALPVALGTLSWAFSCKGFRRHSRFFLLWMLISAGISLGTYSIQSAVIATDVPLWFRPVVALDAYGFLIQKLLIPLNLAADYGRIPARLFQHPSSMALTVPLSCIVLATLIFLTKRRNVLRASWAWFALLLPVSGLVPFAYQNISTVADHYSYLPMAVISAMAFAGLHYLNQRKIARFLSPRNLALSCALLLGVCVHLSFRRAEVWTGNRTFFTDMFEKNPESYSAAIGLAGEECQNHGDFQAAMRWFALCLKQRPLDPVALGNKAFCLYQMGRYPEVLEMQKLFLNPEFLKKSKLHDFATASILASIGSAAAQLGNPEKGLLLTCIAQGKVPFETNYQKNIEILKSVLRSRGIDTNCPAQVDLGQLLSN
jgi:tetratricopeptide (TPR) repeat protein